MKRTISVLLIFLLTLPLVLLCTGCAASDTPTVSTGSDKLKIVTTIFPPYDFARQLSGSLAEVTMLAAPGTEAHDFVATLSDVNAVAQCDLFLYIGGETDTWAQDALSSLGDAAPRAIPLLSLVPQLAETPREGMEIEEEEDDAMDEHVWTSPRNAIAICEGIAAALAEVDPAHADAYAANLEDYRSQLQALDDDFAQVMADSVRSTVVFAERFPFRYLADELGLNCYAAFQGCSSNTEPSLATIGFLTNKILDEQLPVVFYIEFSSETVADTLCAATGAEKRLLHSCHNVSQAELDAGATYLSLMQANVEALAAAVQ